ncbi:hypothetical protein H8D64_00695 [PVC group bacterium]|nr:hypothetical protein [PVC group bacterium]
MRDNENAIWNVLMRMCIAAVLCLGVMTMTGCDDDDKDQSDIRITNLDNHNYTAKLYRNSDNSLVSTISVNNGNTEAFSNVADGTYYITITRTSSSSVADTSSSFTIENNEDKAFYISGSGNIHS